MSDPQSQPPPSFLDADIDLDQAIDAPGAQQPAEPLPPLRKPVAKIDLELLLGENGLPKLRKMGSKLKLAGKGHELDDFRKIMRMYQLWGHHMLPAYKFDRIISEAEKHCHRRPLRVWLSNTITEDRRRRLGIIFSNDPDQPPLTNEQLDEQPADPEALGNAAASSSSSSSVAPASQAMSEDVIARIEQNRRRALVILEEKRLRQQAQGSLPSTSAADASTEATPGPAASAQPSRSSPRSSFDGSDPAAAADPENIRPDEGFEDHHWAEMDQDWERSLEMAEEDERRRLEMRFMEMEQNEF
ncbi:replication fork protection component Swi3-domain-containing protein [Polychytrium aggregatum]|uniref:replication fork protection component Swi3-domain-containing protein n=1 Tax=Polychytrium aggregatum TaxID=110093 RepID=UPI0022FDC47D|nr:replication fork protection component Swi3-domain-containing protein [Polychytrium aggregatum]KAI9207308.1 replication fork protection component Swi3-domain-containing protein [Polychytrium aggregatum]